MSDNEERGRAIAERGVGAIAIAIGASCVLAIGYGASRGFFVELWRSNLALGMLAVLCIWSFRWSFESRARLAMGVASIAVGIFLANLGVFLANQEYRSRLEVRAESARAKGLPYDDRSVLAVVEQESASGNGVVPYVYPKIFIGGGGVETEGGRVLPLAGFSSRRTVMCNETGAYVFFDSDEHGFRNPPGVHAGATLDVAIVGDSFAAGFCVEDGEHTADLLRARGVRAASFGVGGAGPLQELAILREFVAPLRPRTVLWMYYEGNDLVNLAAEKHSSTLMRYLDPDFEQGLPARQADVDAALDRFVERRKEIERTQGPAPIRDAPRAILTLQPLRRALGISVLSPSADEPFGAILARARDDVAGWGGELVFVYLPAFARYAGDGQREDWSARTEVLGVVRELGIPQIDVHALIHEREDPLVYFPLGMMGHYTSAGYALIADAIGSRLTAGL